MKHISILIPCYNEEASLPRLYEALKEFSASTVQIEVDNEPVTMRMDAYEWEFLMVNDGSKDRTRQLLEEFRAADARVSVLNLSRNFGKENAMLAGMDFFRGDALLVMDADLQHPLSAVPEMIYRWEQGYDDVYGRRLSRGNESTLRRALSMRFYRLMTVTGDVAVIENVGDFRLLDRRVVDTLTRLRESQRYTKGLYSWVGFSKKDVAYHTNNRLEGKSSFTFGSLLQLAIEGIIGNSTMPLRISTGVGIISSLLAFIYLIVILVKTLIWGDPVAGFPSMMCVILFLGGIQLIALGIMGEYIGRIFKEVKRRPPYIVDSFNGLKNIKPA